MDEFKCAFSGTLIGGGFGCVRAQHVTRRGGPDVVCGDVSAYGRCADVHARMKSIALPAFGVEDDLLSMPHSVSMKIQFGGLLGLQKQMLDTAAVADAVTDVDALLQQALAHYGGVDALPYTAVVPAMIACKLRRR